MIKNGKYFVEPGQDGANFKKVFLRAVQAGVGRPVDPTGAPVGPWTAELLAEAILQIDVNKSGVDLRTVQRWFEDNNRGIKRHNIAKLAKVFGCDDREATVAWQVELSVSLNRQLTNKLPLNTHRRKECENQSEGRSGETHKATVAAQGQTSIKNWAETTFSVSGTFFVLIVLWSLGALLFFVSYLLNVHDVTYSPVLGLSKQVGLLWSPNWYLDRLVWLPAMVLISTNMVVNWRNEWRPSLNLEYYDSKTWQQVIGSYKYSFWAIAIVSLVIVFLLQWYGSYLRPLIQNDVGQRVVDWLLIAVVEPETMTLGEAIWASGLANLTSGVGYGFCFASLLWSYIVSSDFNDVCGASSSRYDNRKWDEAFEVALSILRATYCNAVLAILAATQIKLIAIYLMTDSANFVEWLVADFWAALGMSSSEWGWFDKSPSASITSFFVLFVPCFLFSVCLEKILAVTQKSNRANARHLLRRKWIKFAIIGAILCANFFLIGKFLGFSIFFFGSIGLALISLIVETGRGRRKVRVFGSVKTKKEPNRCKPLNYQCCAAVSPL